MAVSVISPGWKPEKQKKPEKDALDMIQQGLMIAQAAYGIYADSEKLDLARKAQSDAKELREAELQKTRADTAYTQSKSLSESFPQAKPTQMSTVQGKDDVYAFNPVTGEKKALGIGVKGPEKSGGLDDTKKFEMANTIQKEFQGSIAEVKGRYDSANRVEKLLDVKNPIADSSAKYQFLKASGDSGAVSDKSLETVGGSRSVMARAERAFKKAAEGIELTDQDRIDMKAASATLKRVAQNDIVKQAQRFSKQKAAISPFTEKQIYDEFLRPNELMADLDQMIADAKTEAPQPAYSPQGRPFQQQQRQQQVQATWGQKAGLEAGAAPTPQPSFDFDAYYQRIK